MNPMNDEDKQPERPMDAAVRAHIMQKYGLDQPAAAPDSAISQYQKMVNDESDVAQARETADSEYKKAGLFGALDTAFGGGNGQEAIKGLQKRAQDQLAQTLAARKDKMANLLTQDKVQREQVTRGREDVEHNELTNAASNRSKLYSSMALTRAKQLANEAARAGDKEGSEQFQSLANDLAANKYSAADIGKMQILDKVDYKDVLNNQAAMARVNRQEAGANARQARIENDGRFRKEADLRRMIENDPKMREAVSAENALTSLDSALAQETSIGDEAALMKWQKVLDPISVVRESEFARTQAGAGLLNKLDMAMRQAAGQRRLTPELAKQIKSTVRELRNAHSKYAEGKLHVIDSAVQDYDLNRDNIVSPYIDNLATPNSAEVGDEDAEMLRAAQETLSDPDASNEDKEGAQQVIEMLSK